MKILFENLKNHQLSKVVMKKINGGPDGPVGDDGGDARGPYRCYAGPDWIGDYDGEPIQRLVERLSDQYGPIVKCCSLYSGCN